MQTTLTVIKADITTVHADAIVNAANTSLLGGAGVDGAIHRKGGPSILEECLEIRIKQGGCLVGEAVLTTAGNLPAKYVIHTVGPVWQGGENDEKILLGNCYRNSLLLAVQHNVKTIAFPNISTGIYHFPKEQAAGIAFNEVKKFISLDRAIESVIFVCFDDENYSIYQKLLATGKSND
ncbi:MAG: O-acetyl-ADP-ribose deacetylase [Chitinophagaceae bacterium]|nr:O-acetyl-ADP-ribose deacetylase [Chitinophagaceae bacterium]